MGVRKRARPEEQEAGPGYVDPLATAPIRAHGWRVCVTTRGALPVPFWRALCMCASDALGVVGQSETKVVAVMVKIVDVCTYCEKK